MAEGEFVIVGPPRAMILYKDPAEVREEDRRLIAAVDIVGVWENGYFLATCSKAKIPRLRDAGAEVIVLDPDANRYAAMVHRLPEAEVKTMIAQRQAQAEHDLRLAELGRDRDDSGTG